MTGVQTCALPICFPVTIRGGVSANGAQGQGVTQPTDRSVEMGLKQQGLGLQLASIASQVDLNKSQAKKNEAEANKIAGVDTKAQEAKS